MCNQVSVTPNMALLNAQTNGKPTALRPKNATRSWRRRCTQAANWNNDLRPALKWFYNYFLLWLASPTACHNYTRRTTATVETRPITVSAIEETGNRPTGENRNCCVQ